MTHNNLISAQEKFLNGDIEIAKKICLNLLKKKNDTNVLNFLGVIELSKKNYLESFKNFNRSLKISPRNVKALNNAGNVLIAINKNNTAIVFLKKAIKIDKKFIQTYLNISIAYINIHNTTKAALYLKKLLVIDKNNFTALNNLGNIFHEKKEYNKSLEYYLKALELNSNDEILHNNLGLLYEKQHKFKKAKLHFQESLNIKPNFFDCQFNLSLLNLKIGSCKEGIALYDSRFYKKEKRSKLDINLDVLKLTLHKINKSKKIYIISEQGFGDIFQFSRVGLILQKIGYTVVFIINDNLYEFFSKQKIFNEYLKTSDLNYNLIPSDKIIPLLSVPRIFELDANKLNTNTMYIEADSNKIKHWSNKINNKKFNIGIVWATAQNNYYNRNVPLNLFKQFNKLKKIQLISLHTNKDISNMNIKMVDLNGIIIFKNLDIENKFVDTAAIIKNLDLVISIDSAVAHLSAAMGKKTWILLSHHHDWRWSIKTNKSYWYQSVRLFRNKKNSDWKQIMKKVALELNKILKKN